jgi:hypothetical protein
MREKTLLRLTLMFCLTAAAATGLIARPADGHRGRLSLVNSIERNGTTVKVALEDGTTVEFPAARLRVVGARAHEANGILASTPEGEKTLSALSARKSSSSRLPAAIHLVVKADGRVRRARLRVFEQEADAAAFVRSANESRAASAAKRTAKADQQ